MRLLLIRGRGEEDGAEGQEEAEGSGGIVRSCCLVRARGSRGVVDTGREFCIRRAASLVAEIRYLTCRQWLHSQLAKLGRAFLDFH